MNKLSRSELQELGENSIPVNKYKLEEEATKQPDLFVKWFLYYEELYADVKEAKYNLVETKDKVSIRIRQLSKEDFENTYRFPLPGRGLTESLLFSLINSNPKVRKCTSNIFYLERRLGLVKGIVEAAKMRKSMLEVLTSLFIAKYWSKPEADAFRRKKVKKV